MARQRRAGGGVDQLPSGRYRVRIVTADGRRVSLGTFATKRAAEATYARSLTEQADGKVVAPPAERGTTVGEYAPRWVESRLTSKGEPLRQRVRELYAKQLDAPHPPDARGRRRSTGSTLRRSGGGWSTSGDRAGPGVSTAAKCYRLLRSIMATAVEDGLALTNPCTIKGAGTEPKPETEIPTVAEVHKLADCLDERLRCMVLLAAFMGLRKGELLGLRRGDVDLDARVLTVREQRQSAWSGKQLVGPPKTEAGRRSIAIPSALIDELEHHLDRYTQSRRRRLLLHRRQGRPAQPLGLDDEVGRGPSEGRRRAHPPARPPPPRRHPRRGDGCRHQGAHAPPRPRQPEGGTHLPARHPRARHRHRRSDERAHRALIYYLGPPLERKGLRVAERVPAAVTLWADALLGQDVERVWIEGDLVRHCAQCEPSRRVSDCDVLDPELDS